ncbi:type II toxin-antitoxin system HicA family toxin [Aureibacillus halotolerans]|uniref:HicA-like toxin of HicAB toxin-antitoxin system n=1 Tax=Aureibacillus halotolerans TaxID=1508390 RepID=A0A4R6U7S9_9BACI|nr:type II toxin-antitoxin system HicA family toxin [Aureibacillus halotolerans]TDQ40809.1 hypothetical protein EV213_105155 [Aureibacillus halotolerans]
MPSWREIERFCRKDGWEEYKKKSHHIYFREKLKNGDLKRTRVSRGTGEVNGHKWKEILNKQLQVTEENLIPPSRAGQLVSFLLFTICTDLCKL